MPLSAYVRALAIVARAAVELAVHALIAPGKPAMICRRTGRVKAA